MHNFRYYLFHTYDILFNNKWNKGFGLYRIDRSTLIDYYRSKYLIVITKNRRKIFIVIDYLDPMEHFANNANKIFTLYYYDERSQRDDERTMKYKEQLTSIITNVDI